MLFETKLKCYDTTHECFIGKALMTVRLFPQYIEVIYDCEKESLVEDDLLGERWEAETFLSKNYLLREKVLWVAMEWLEDQDQYRVHLAGLENFYFNFFFKIETRADDFKEILLKWLTDAPNFKFYNTGENFKSDE